MYACWSDRLHNSTLLFPCYCLRILAIDDPKISQKLAFLGYWHKCIHGTPIHLILKFGAGSHIIPVLRVHPIKLMGDISDAGYFLSVLHILSGRPITS